jgi:hypothetical protein
MNSIPSKKKPHPRRIEEREKGQRFFASSENIPPEKPSVNGDPPDFQVMLKR